MDTPAAESINVELHSKLARLKAAAAAEPYPSAETRRDRLRRAVDVLQRSDKRIHEAIGADFGGRPEALNLLVDTLAPIRSLKHSIKHLDNWMRVDRRKPEFPMGLIGGKAGVFYQPLGVVGNVSPWNAPVALAFTPLASILAAGNRAFLKPSELVPQTAELIADMVRSAFDPGEIDVVTGDVHVSQAFVSLPFDHLVFTGGAGTARHVMRAAAENLVPVTLELGGKSPCIVARGSDLAYAAGKFANGKCVNAGQVCMAPDFAFVHRDDLPKFADEVRGAVKRMFPDYAKSADFTRVHLDRQRQRLSALVRNAIERGAKVEVLDGTPVEELANCAKFPPVLILDPPLDAEVMQEEVFGPLIPVITYDTLRGVADVLGKLSRPLALYFLGGSAEDKDFILKNTWAGGVSFDDVMLHPFMQEVAFGGVGESGMGRYLGFDGFKAMSNAKGFAQRPWIDVTKYIAPPFGPGIVNGLRKALRF